MECKGASETNPNGSIWQFTHNICGLEESPIENVTLRNIHLELDGGVTEYESEVPEIPMDYPEVFTYGKTLHSKGIHMRNINGITVENVSVTTCRPDAREELVFSNIKNLKKS